VDAANARDIGFLRGFQKTAGAGMCQEMVWRRKSGAAKSGVWLLLSRDGFTTRGPGTIRKFGFGRKRKKKMKKRRRKKENMPERWPAIRDLSE